MSLIQVGCKRLSDRAAGASTHCHPDQSEQDVWSSARRRAANPSLRRPPEGGTPNRGSGKFLSTAALAGLCLVVTLPAAEEPKPADTKANAISIATLRRTAPVDFEKEILPILKNNCLACHNQTKSKAGLVLETPQTILKGGDTGPAVVPRRSKDSLLLKAAAHQDPDLSMPPRDNKVGATNLTPHELGLLKLWIDQGAKGEVRGLGPIIWQPLPPGLNPIFAVALTADGQFAAAGRASQIFIYHVPSGQLVTRLTDPQLLKANLYGKAGVAHRDLIESLAFNPEGDILASGSYREVKIWRRSKNVPKFTLAGARDAVRAVAASPDGKWLATGGADHGIRLWEAAAGKLVKEFSGHAAAITALRFSPDKTKLASTAADKAIRVWEVPSGNLFAQSETGAEINAVTWTVDGKQVATGGADNLIRLWQLPEAAGGALPQIKELKGHEGPVTALDTLSATNHQILSGSADGSLRLWDLEKGEVIQQMKHGGAVTAVAVRADGKRFASAGLDHSAKLWAASDGKQIAELKGDRYARELAEERERAVTLAAAELSYRKTVLQNAEKQQTNSLERLTKATNALATAAKNFEEKQKALQSATEAKTAADKALMELDPEVRKAFEAHAAAEKEATNAVAAAKEAKEKEKKDKTRVEKLETEAEAKSKAAAEAKAAVDKLPDDAKQKYKKLNEEVTAAAKKVADAEKEFKRAEPTKNNAEREVQAARDGIEKAANDVAEARTGIQRAEDQQKQVQADLEAGKKAAAESEKPIRAVAFSPDNLTVATAGDDQFVHTWSADSGAAFETFKGHTGAVFSVAFNDHGRLISGAADLNALVWDLNAGWTLEKVIGTGDDKSSLADRVNALHFSPDGKLLATGGGEPTRGGEIKIWQVADGKLAQDLKNLHSDAVFALDFTADGKLLATGAADKFVRVVDLATGKILKSFEGHTHHVLGVSWKRDGRTLVSAGADNVMKVWDFVTGERKKNIEGFGKEVTSISFIGVTDQFVACAGDGQVKMFRDNGESVRSFSGGDDFTHSLAVTPDGRIVVAGGQDSVLRVWNGTNGDVVATFGAPETRLSSK